jgi:hypothetical protein
MTYSVCDFVDSILDALGIQTTDENRDDPAAQANLALAEIARLQQRAQALTLMETPLANRLHRVQMAVSLIRTARNHLREAGAGNAADYAARALKSAEGAERHARRLASETPPAAVPAG